MHSFPQLVRESSSLNPHRKSGLSGNDDVRAEVSEVVGVVVFITGGAGDSREVETGIAATGLVVKGAEDAVTTSSENSLI